MIPYKHHHYDQLETFLEKKFSASPDDTSYTYGGKGKVYPGEPDISWRSIVYVKDAGLICTHGRIYDASGEATNLKTPVLINGVSFDGGSDVVTKVWGEPRNILITDGTNTSEPTLSDGGRDIVLSLPALIDASVTKDSEGRIISETYPTYEDLQEALDGMETFFVYSGEDETDPTLLTPPANEWDTHEKLNTHAGDYYVTSDGRVFQFKEEPTGVWVWKEITDYYLYNCLGELREVKKKVDITGEWEKVPQTSIETSDIFVKGRIETRPYLDVLCCPGFVNYKLSDSATLYLPFSYGGSWTRTKTKYYRELQLIRSVDLSRISGKTFVVTNQEDSLGILTLDLGNSPTGNSKTIELYPGKVCILKFKADILGGNLVFYWESTEVGGTGLTHGWI